MKLVSVGLPTYHSIPFQIEVIKERRQFLIAPLVVAVVLIAIAIVVVTVILKRTGSKITI